MNLQTLNGLSLPAQQLLSGATAGLGVLLVAVVTGLIGGLEAAAAATVGAMCTSIVDIPDPPEFKPPGFIAAAGFGGLITLAVDLSFGHAALTALIVAVTSFAAAMVTAYGRTTLPLCMAMILAMVLALGTHAGGSIALDAPHRAALFTLGGAGYAVYGMLVARLLEVRYKRLSLVDAMLAFSAYVRCKAQLYDPGSELDQTYRVLIERQVSLMEKVQTARNLALRHLSDARHRRMAASLSLLIDAFESILSSQADFWLLRRHYGQAAILPAIRDGASQIADLVAEFADEIRTGRPGRPAEPLKARWAEIAAMAAEAVPAEPDGDVAEAERARLELNAVILRISHSLDIVLRLQHAMRDATAAEAVLGRINPAAFLPPQPYRLRVLLRQLRWRSPIFRYALRLTAAMLCAFAVAELMTRYFEHGSWILLTVAVIMRASYSATKQRQKDRLIGNLVGCVLAAIALHLLHDLALLGLIFLAIGTAHAYAAVRYRITSTAAAVMALVMLHFLNPSQDNLLLERLLDTGIGSAIAFVFSFMLPSWERQGLQDRIRGLLRANRQYAHQSLRLTLQEQTYRLARKAAFDSIGEFAGMIRRIPDEPGAQRHDLDLLFRLMAANYRLTAMLAALQLLLRRRRAELPPADTEKRLAAASAHLRRLLGGGSAEDPPSLNAPLNAAGPAAAALERRLREAEAIARQIQEIAAQLRTGAAPLVAGDGRGMSASSAR